MMIQKAFYCIREFRDLRYQGVKLAVHILRILASHQQLPTEVFKAVIELLQPCSDYPHLLRVTWMVLIRLVLCSCCITADGVRHHRVEV